MLALGSVLYKICVTATAFVNLINGYLRLVSIHKLDSILITNCLLYANNFIDEIKGFPNCWIAPSYTIHCTVSSSNCYCCTSGSSSSYWYSCTASSSSILLPAIVGSVLDFKSRFRSACISTTAFVNLIIGYFRIHLRLVRPCHQSHTTQHKTIKIRI